MWMMGVCGSDVDDTIKKGGRCNQTMRDYAAMRKNIGVRSQISARTTRYSGEQGGPGWPNSGLVDLGPGWSWHESALSAVVLTRQDSAIISTAGNRDWREKNIGVIETMASFATRSLASSSTQRVIRPLKSASMPLPAFQKPSLGFSMRTARTPARIVCMANPRRVARVASEIQRQVGSMFASDSVVQNAISPDRRLGVDSEMSAVASVTNVHVTNDLGLVRIYYSVYSDQRGKQRAVENLKKLEPYVRKEIGRRVDLRRVPEIRFEYDNTEEEMEARGVWAQGGEARGVRDEGGGDEEEAEAGGDEEVEAGAEVGAGT
eukprot:gene15924-22057_t